MLADFLSRYMHFSQEVQENVLEQVLEDGVAVDHVSIAPTEEESSTSWPSIDTMRLWVRRHRKRERLYIGAIACFLERHRVPVGVWNQGFACFSHLIHLAEQLLQQAIHSSCLLGKMNILLTISQPRLWI